MKTKQHTLRRFVRSSVLLSVTAASWSALAAPTYQSVIQSDGPLAYYRFGDALNPDIATNSAVLGAAGNGTHGPGVVHRVPGALAGNNNAAAAYNDVGGAKHTFVPFSAAINPPANRPFSVEFWANPSVEVSDAPGPCPLFNRVSAGNRSGWVFFQRSPASGWNFVMYNGSGSNRGIDLTGGSNAQNTWSHVVAVWNGTAATLYVNGTAVSNAVPVGGYAASTSAIFSVGSYDDGVQNPFNGSVDEVTVYTNALTAPQVLAHYQNGTNAVRLIGYETMVAIDGAIEYLRLDEPNPNFDTAINSGRLGAAADGTHFPGLAHQVPGAIAGSSDTAAGYSAIDAVSNDGGVPTIVPYLPDLNPAGSFTVEAWLKPTIATLANQQCPLYNRITAGGSFPNREGWDVFQQAAGWRFRMFNGNGGNTVFNVTAGPLTVGGWQHLVAVYNASTPSLTVYVNGVAQSSSAPNGIYAANSSAPFAIGGFPLYSNGHYENPFTGSIDEVALYTNALSGAQVLAHYQNGTNAARLTPYETLVGLDGPVAYWRLDEPARNVATNIGTLGAGANGTYATVTNGIYFSLPNSVAGPQAPALAGFETNNLAANFDGGTNYVELLNPASLNFTGRITVEAWIQPAAAQNNFADIIAHGVNDTDNAEDVLRITDSTSYLAASWDGANHGVSFDVPGDLGSGNWVHLAGTYDGTNWNLFRNGVLAGSVADSTGALLVTNANWAVGARGRWKFATGLERLFTGPIDEVAIYNYALSQNRIQAHYSMGAFGSGPLTITRSGANVILTWPSGTLQEATAITGPFLDNLATSPYTTPASGPQKFYRVRFQ